MQQIAIRLCQIDEDSSREENNGSQGHVRVIAAEGDHSERANEECRVAENPPDPLRRGFPCICLRIKTVAERKEARKEKLEGNKRKEKQNKAEQMKRCRLPVRRGVERPLN